MRLTPEGMLAAGVIATSVAIGLGYNHLSGPEEPKRITFEYDTESAERARQHIIADTTAELAEARDGATVTASEDTIIVNKPDETFSVTADAAGKLTITHTDDTAPTTTVTLFVNKDLIPITYELNPDGKTANEVVNLEPSNIKDILGQLDTQSMKPSNEPVSYTEEQPGKAAGASFAVEIGKTKTINVDGTSTRRSFAEATVSSLVNGELQPITKETAQSILDGVLDLEPKEQ